MKLMHSVLLASVLAGCALSTQSSDATPLFDIVELPTGQVATIPTNSYFIDGESYCDGSGNLFDCRERLSGIRHLANELRTDLVFAKAEPLNIEGIMMTHNYWLSVRVGEFQRGYKAVGR